MRLNSRYLVAVLGLIVALNVNSIKVFSSTPGTRSESTETDAGLIALCINDDGFLGNGFSSYDPSCEYPLYSNVEHLYFGGLWVGGVSSDGEHRVSTSAQDAYGWNGLNEKREFSRVAYNWPNEHESFHLMSNEGNDINFDPDALAPFHLTNIFDDYRIDAPVDHVPLGVRVELNVLAWTRQELDDFVILDYAITNITDTTLHDLYIGYFNDTTVGNTDVTNPYDYSTPHPWNYYDDLNGAWRPGDLLDDIFIWMMQEHDGDGEDGLATSWIGCRLLGSSSLPEPEEDVAPVSYNAWSFTHVPDEDDWYLDPDDPDTPVPGKYQLMGNGQFDVGITPDGDFTGTGNRLALLSTGPFPTLGQGETLHVVYAIVCGDGENELLLNSRAAQQIYENNYEFDLSPVQDTPARKSKLSPNAPNPFNPSTRLAFVLAEEGQTRVTIHDLHGRLVRTLVDEFLPIGEHNERWDGKDDGGVQVGAGVYLVRLENSGDVDQQKIVLVK